MQCFDISATSKEKTEIFIKTISDTLESFKFLIKFR